MAYVLERRDVDVWDTIRDANGNDWAVMIGDGWVYPLADAVRAARCAGVSRADAARYVKEERELFEDWLENRWHYVTVTVAPIDADGRIDMDRSESMGGVDMYESGFGAKSARSREYVLGTARGMIPDA